MIVESDSCELLESITFDDFLKLNMLLYIREGKPSVFIEFWVRVSFPLLLALQSSQ